MTKYILLVIPLLVFISCKKKSELSPEIASTIPKVDSIVHPTEGTTLHPMGPGFKIQFKNVAGSQDIKENIEYTNQLGEKFKLNKFQYYLSNFVLTTTDSQKVYLNDRYFLINAFSRDTITLPNIPEKEFTSISFMIGVDSAKSTGGLQNGDLDPANNMFWPAMGYTYLALEGTFSMGTAAGNFTYDIKGYNPLKYYAVQQVQFTFSGSIKYKHNTKLLFHVDILEAFKSPADFSIVTTPQIIDKGQKAMDFSNNYKDMFSLVKIE